MCTVFTYHDRGGNKIKSLVCRAVVRFWGLEEHTYQIIRISQYTREDAHKYRFKLGGESHCGSFRVKIECNRLKNKIVSHRIV